MIRKRKFEKLEWQNKKKYDKYSCANEVKSCVNSLLFFSMEWGRSLACVEVKTLN